MAKMHVTPQEALKRYEKLIEMVMAGGGFKKRADLEYYELSLDSLTSVVTAYVEDHTAELNKDLLNS